MTINLTVPTSSETPELKPRITVIGVGGAGGNAVNNMIESGLEGVDFLVANSDAQALAHSKAERRIQMGVNLTQGLGAGANPEVGSAAAQESLAEILEELGQSNMVFITAGLGGGTGTGGAPIIAEAARQHGILTVGVVTKPFQFEGSKRMRIAEAGLEELQQYVDTLLIIPNQNLFRVANENTTFADAFKMADDVLCSGVRGVTDLMVMPGLINLDFADIRAVMAEMGKAMMGTGEAEGERRAVEAAEAAIANPLLDDTSMAGAKGVLINITAGPDITLFEVDEAANRIRDEVDPEADIIFGSTFDDTLEGRIRVSVVATGIEAAAGVRPKPIVRQITMAAAAPAPMPEPKAEPEPEPEPETAAVAETEIAAMAEVLAEAEAEIKQFPVPEPVEVAATVEPKAEDSVVEAEAGAFDELEEVPLIPSEDDVSIAEEPMVQEVAEAVGQNTIPVDPAMPPGDAFIPAPPASEVPAAPDPFAAADMVNAGVESPAPRARGGLSLFERVTGVGRADRNDTMQTSATEASEAVQPAPTPVSEGLPAPVLSAGAVVASEGESDNAPEVEIIGGPDSGDDEGMLGNLDPADRLTTSQEDDDLLDIPAFLRRQAN